MKKTICLVLVVVAMLFSSVVPGYADRHGHFSFRGGVWIGPGWGGWGPWWWGPPGYPYYRDYYGEPPVVIQQQSPEYVQPSPQPEQQYYWYYCPDSKNYYPYVKKCPGGWLKVVPPQSPSDERE